MAIKLDNPRMLLDKKILAKDTLSIRQAEFSRWIRRRVPFFMDGYRYAAAAVKRRWGIDVVFFEAGKGVMPVYLSGSLNKKGAEVWWKMMREDKNFAKSLVKEVSNIVTVEKNLARSVPKRGLTSKEIEKFLLKHLEWWIQFFEAAYLWFGVENIKEKIDAEIKDKWKGSDRDLKNFLDTVYRPMRFPLSSREQRDLLRVSSLSGKALDQSLAVHVKKYRHLSLHNIDDEYFDKSYYLGRIKLLKKPSEYLKQKKLLETADREVAAANATIRAAKLPTYLKERINFVRWFMYIRTETVDHFMLVHGAYKSVFNSMSKLLALPVEALLHMTYKELIDSVRKGDLTVSRDLVFERTKRGYAYLIAPHSSFLVIGKEANWLHNFVMPKKKEEKVKQLSGQIAFPGKITGLARVILDRRKAHELKKGEILVTTMTSPEFVPSMKIAGGIITNEGGILCHAAIMSREFRKPCVIGTKIATDVIKTGQIITLDADNGIVNLK